MSEPAMTKTVNEAKNGIAIETYHITDEPFYLPLGDEIAVFETAYRLKLPVMLKGPTGCGKTRFL
jgi:nitric oxide reductase NorQ protein